jgi:hypothetical protein
MKPKKTLWKTIEVASHLQKSTQDCKGDQQKKHKTTRYPLHKDVWSKQTNSAAM